MPEEIAQDERKMYHYLLENKNEEENIFFCDNYSYIDEFRSSFNELPLNLMDLQIGMTGMKK